jgi:hypothetical protein
MCIQFAPPRPEPNDADAQLLALDLMEFAAAWLSAASFNNGMTFAQARALVRDHTDYWKAVRAMKESGL